MSETHTGACLCGAVSYRVEGPLRPVVFCHCSQCRRQTGMYYACTAADNVDIIISGEDEITWYASSEKGRRGFCKQCGSALFWRYEGQSHTSIHAGSVDQPSGLTPGYHIFCADKGDFYEILDDLPKFPKDSPDLATNTG